MDKFFKLNFFESILSEFINFIDCQKLSETNIFFKQKLNKLSNNLLKEYKYYQHLNLYQKDRLKSDPNFLIKNEFPFIIENQQIQPLINYIDNNPNLAIIGGYITSMYFEFPFFEESDIDIYIFSENYNLNYDIFEDFVIFLDKTYNIDEVEISGNSVRAFTFKNFNRKIQIILIGFNNILDIILTFDCTHNRCAYYLGNTYITFDAQYSKKYQQTYYFNKVRPTRYKKALKYKLKVINNVKKINIKNIIDDTVFSQNYKWLQNGKIKCFKNLKISIFKYFYSPKNVNNLIIPKTLDILEINFKYVIFDFKLRKKFKIKYLTSKILTFDFNSYLNCISGLKIIYTFNGKLFKYSKNDNICYLLIYDIKKVEKIRKIILENIVTKTFEGKQFIFKDGFKKFIKCFTLKIDKNCSQFYGKNVSIMFNFSLYCTEMQKQNNNDVYLNHFPMEIKENKN